MNRTVLSILAIALPGTASAQELSWESNEVAPGIYMFEGQGGFTGGNLGLFVGEDGIVLIDDGIPEVSAATLAAVGVDVDALDVPLVADGHDDLLVGNQLFHAEVADSLVLGLETSGGDYFMPLFVVLTDGLELDAGLKKKINAKIRRTLSPRHVPDEIYAISEVPRTLNAKKLEVPVKKILAGLPVEKAVNVDSMANPDSIDFFVELAKKIR